VAPGIRLLLIDGLNLIRRVYAAQPGPDGPERAEAGRISCLQSLQRAVREVEPSHALVVLEGAEPTWRHRLFPGYKAGHAPMPEALRAALPAYRAAFAELGVRSFELDGCEADDVVATLAVKLADAGGAAVILSTDKIFGQLLSERIGVRDHFARRDLDRGQLLARFGVPPERLLDLLALCGDSTNGIPGVPGVGPKTAARLLGSFGTLDELLAAAGAAGDPGLSPKLAGKLVAHADSARLARTLLGLRVDLELGINLKELRLPG
jgi:5'-3' exonuclease